MTELNLTTAKAELKRPTVIGSGVLLGDTVKFKTIVADPPWNIKFGSTRTPCGDKDGWDKNMKIKDLEYPTMSIEEICALKVPADDAAHLYIWTINKYIEQTYAVARAWGFTPSTMLYWLKQPIGLGLGGAFVPCVEPILFCRRGKLAPKRRIDRNWWSWPRARHSQKPEGFQTVVESVSPGPYLEMFARRKRLGWQVWGNELPNDINLVSPNSIIHPNSVGDIGLGFQGSRVNL